tara:strand:+ start:126 stop:269 length:144 start_codon:yes stop_codon:yes gene_type:complete
MYKKIQLTLCGLAMGGIWYNIFYQSCNVNLNKKEENEVMELYKDIIN